MPIDTKYGRVTLERQRHIEDDEPVVVFRAADRTVLKVLKVYRYFCELAGSPANHLAGIDQAAAAIKAWQASHPTKTPDSVGFEPDA